ncbi:winged helix-turn-helix domain-containing protein [Paenibacillus monticola]|uniref:Uncharacterized protein n=1 Tax=Paenibacillus monticola TaxID=2666075 RepID=A0A7X2HB12_9BACL|nr:winged helix-turn-helix domain-containing protein [Paenibacillus monticola]MRN56804.1 hypothetical protein [Paenibacillus monticola]
MTETARELNMGGLLNQYEAIGGPEEFGPEGLAIMVALWRKSSKLGWKQAFQMTNTELTLQTGIKSRGTINTHRNKLVDAGLIGYSPPPKGSSRGNYTVTFHLIDGAEVVQLSNIFQKVGSEVVQNMDYFSEVDGKAVQKLNHYTNTVLKDLSTTITTPITGNEFEDEINEDPKFNAMIDILNAYTELHGKLDFHVKPREREAMGKMVAGGMPNPFTIRTMELLLEEKRKREGADFKLPTSFLYYENAIYEAWRNSQTSAAPTDGVAQGTPDKPQRKTKQQRELEELDMMIEEERRRGEGGSDHSGPHH